MLFIVVVSLLLLLLPSLLCLVCSCDVCLFVICNVCLCVCVCVITGVLCAITLQLMKDAGATVTITTHRQDPLALSSNSVNKGEIDEHVALSRNSFCLDDIIGEDNFRKFRRA